MKRTAVKAVKEYILILLGSLIYSFALVLFVTPNHIAAGGVTGISIILTHLTGISVGSFYFLINIPIIILGFRYIGKKFVMKSLFSIAIISLVTDLLEGVLIPYKNDMMLACLFGGVMTGTALSLCFLAGGSTGGIDIITKLIKIRYPFAKLGKIILIIDGIIISFAMLTFRNIEVGLYSAIVILVGSLTLDKLIYGLNVNKSVTIISEKEKEICDMILHKVVRGCTLLSGTGGYSGKGQGIVLTVVSKSEFHKLVKLIGAIDQNAFIIASDALEVIGKGFELR